MKIGFFSDRYLPLTDGIAYSIESFRTELEAMGHEVYIFAPKPNLRYKEPSKHIIRFPAVKGLFWEDYMSSFFFPPQAVKQVEKLKLDIVHFHTPGQLGMFGAYFALRHNIPLVTTYHTDLYEYVKHYPAVLPGTIALSMLAPVITGGGMDEYRTAMSSIKPERSIDNWNQKIVERGVTLIHNHCDLVIAPSAKMERQLKSWKTTSPIAILPTGVDEITTTSAKIDEVRAQYDLSVHDQVILFVGRIGTEKNISLLIKSFNTVAKKNSAAKLVLVGSGDDLDVFQAQAAKSRFADRILFTGRLDRPELGAIYRIAAVFAFPSLGDTQGLVIPEAALAEVPVVMVDPAITEVVKDGVSGYFAKKTAKDLAAKILAVLNNEAKRRQMGRASRKLALEYGASQQAAKLLRLYQTTIEQHSAKEPQTQASFFHPGRSRNT
jgi:1,2-diacylglycerol 3-alpha-glucosyltransferase